MDVYLLLCQLQTLALPNKRWRGQRKEREFVKDATGCNGIIKTHLESASMPHFL